MPPLINAADGSKNTTKCRPGVKAAPNRNINTVVFNYFDMV